MSSQSAVSAGQPGLGPGAVKGQALENKRELNKFHQREVTIFLNTDSKTQKQYRVRIERNCNGVVMFAYRQGAKSSSAPGREQYHDVIPVQSPWSLGVDLVVCLQ